MICRVDNIKAENGETSKLYDDLLEYYQDQKKALKQYLHTFTDEFKSWYDGKMDKNGEPVLTNGNFYNKKDISYYSEEEAVFDETDNKIKYQKTNQSKEDFIASEKTIRDLAEKIADRIGLKVRYESDRTKNYKGKLEGDTAVINLAYATLNTPIHEILGHPIIRALKTGTASNKQLYQNLLKELEYGKGKEVLDRIKKNYVYKKEVPNSYQTDFADFYTQDGKYYIYYPIDGDTEEISKNEFEKNIPNNYKYTLEKQQEEAIVQLLGEYTADRIKKDTNLWKLLRQLLKEMKAYMKELITGRPDINKIVEEEVTYIDEEGNLCAKTGLTNTTKGTGWKVVKNFKGKPKHKYGGVDISISNKGISMRRGGKEISAKHGLLLPATFRS